METVSFDKNQGYTVNQSDSPQRLGTKWGKIHLTGETGDNTKRKCAQATKLITNDINVNSSIREELAELMHLLKSILSVRKSSVSSRTPQTN